MKNSSSQSSDTSTTSEVADVSSLNNTENCSAIADAIFAMEDIDTDPQVGHII